MNNKVYTAIGLMSGTSLDGEIDVALLETDGQDHVKPLDFKPFPYERGVSEAVRACFGKRKPDTQTQKAEEMVTDLHIAAVKSVADHPVIRSSGYPLLIGFHGQTITHDPANNFTWQLGDGQRLAQETGIDVVFDLRQADIKSGGEGAPLIPLYHLARIQSDNIKRPVAVINLGGVGNITYIGSSDCLPRKGGDLVETGEKVPAFAGTADFCEILAFDTGPANALMDDCMKARLGLPFDEGGKFAKSGSPNEELLQAWLSHPYFDQKPPKSLDRNEFAYTLSPSPAPLNPPSLSPMVSGQRPEENASLNGGEGGGKTEWNEVRGEGVGTLSVEDTMATLAEFTVRSLEKAMEHLPQKPKAIYVTGGGRKNDFLMAILGSRLGVNVQPVEKLGWNGDAIEAEGFAYLAVRSLLGLPLTLPTTTGVNAPLTGGILHRAA